MSGTDLTVLVTGCGAPGTIGTLWSLEHNPDDRSISTVGVDMREEQPGRYVCDTFASVPAAESADFVDDLVTICDEKDVDVVLPQVTAELPVLSASTDQFARVGTEVAISTREAIARSNDKRNLIDVCDEVGVPSPTTIGVETMDGLESAARRLGFPDEPIVVKPPVSNGQRGFRIVTDGKNEKERFYEQKPDGTKTTLEQLRAVLGETFPELLAMEYLPGEEFTIDAFRNDDETVIVPRSRDQIRSGISFRTTVTNEGELVDYAETLADELDLEYAFGFQFKRASDGTPKILECNPRIQGTMVASAISGANVVYAAVQSSLDEPVPEMAPSWGTTFHRYWGGLGIEDDRIVGDVANGIDT